ncbi:MAG: YqjF family protein [Blastocatellales bacterium]
MREFLTAEWRHLAMLNYEVDPTILAPMIPRGVELDAWNGRYFVSVVGFLFLNTRVLGLPIPFHQNFEEINLRFYVRRRGPEGWRRGVVFIKEIVPRWAIATVARVVYNENYVARPMSHRIDLNNGQIKGVASNGSVEYSWLEGGSWHLVSAKTAGEARPLVAGSEEEFITEHYWGYAAQRDGGSVEYQVEHPRWRVWQVSEAAFECDVKQVYGSQFVECLGVAPSSAFVADGSEIVVRKGVRL